MSVHLPVLQVILPVGISFYTFEAINYTVDVYRRQVPAERNPAHLLFFVLFFPHLIAGPIVRARDFLPQIRRSKHWSWARFQLGGEYFLLGLIKKWVVADQLAPIADPVFADPGAFGTAANWLALLAFTVQVYCDISGYSDMALGTGPPARLQAGRQLQHALPGHQRRGLLAARPHLAVDLAARLPVHSAGRQPRHAAGRPAATC